MATKKGRAKKSEPAYVWIIEEPKKGEHSPYIYAGVNKTEAAGRQTLRSIIAQLQRWNESTKGYRLVRYRAEEVLETTE